MEVQLDRDTYERMATDCQIVLIDLLNRSLKDSGVNDKEKRQRICERFSEAAGDFIDQGWFKSEDSGGRKVYPLLCFAERGDWSDTEVGPITQAIGPDPTSFFYESFSASCEWYFDEHNEALEGIETGSC